MSNIVKYVVGAAVITGMVFLGGVNFGKTIGGRDSDARAEYARELGFNEGRGTNTNTEVEATGQNVYNLGQEAWYSGMEEGLKMGTRFSWKYITILAKNDNLDKKDLIFALEDPIIKTNFMEKAEEMLNNYRKNNQSPLDHL